MQVYLVGGAVRDELLGLPVRERDWCVVGATVEEMLRQHFKPVGKDFPVFLHPESNEEYALARTERKTAPGYHGFEFQATAEVSIEDDLLRRDLTINAMAKDADGKLIDPHGGARDIELRLLRHVSDAFAEDPVRILRAARFAARFSRFGFRIAAETRDLMRRMVADGEADALVPDRVWKEMQLALAGPDPRNFFECLRGCNALRVVLPEVDALFGVPQPPQWHPEVDTGVHSMLVLDQAAALSEDPAVRFAALCHDFGKARTDPAHWPKHAGHEKLGVDLIRALAERLPLPRDYRDLALLVAEFHGHCHRVGELRDATVVKVLERTDAFRRPERFAKFLLACEADARGRTGLECRDYEQAQSFRELLAAAAAVDASRIAADGKLRGDAIGEALRRARIEAVAARRAA